MRVEKFYLFFNPGYTVYKKQIGETEYGIGWLPLGGYVKIAGMMDESMDKEQLAQEPQPWEFRTKPAWQRLIVMLGGVTVNFLLGFFIWAMILWVYGKEYIPAKNVSAGIQVVDSSMCQQLGLLSGDKILKIGDQAFDHFDQRPILTGIVVGGAKTITVERQGKVEELPVKAGLENEMASYKGVLFAPRMPFVIAGLDSKGGASKAGMLAGDSLVGINGQELAFFHEFKQVLEQNKGKRIELAYYRQGSLRRDSVTLNAEGQLGVFPKGIATEKEHFGLFEAIPMGVNEGMKFLWANIVGLGKMITGQIDASKNLGGFISIAKLFRPTWDWEHFWRMTAILSLILAFMNLLPIPALDGGHAVFAIWEIIFRRAPNPKFLEYAQLVGIILLFSLLIYANGMDIYRNLISR
jgi:regulator of sigma E protease